MTGFSSSGERVDPDPDVGLVGRQPHPVLEFVRRFRRDDVGIDDHEPRDPLRPESEELIASSGPSNESDVHGAKVDSPDFGIVSAM